MERWRWCCLFYGAELVSEFKARNDAAEIVGENEIIPSEIFDTVINEITTMHRFIADTEFYSEIKACTGAVGCILPSCPNLKFYTWAKEVVENPEITPILSNSAGNKTNRLNYAQFESVVYQLSKPAENQ